MTKLLHILSLFCLCFLATACGSKKGGGTGEVPQVGDFYFSLSGGRASLSVVFPELGVDSGVRIPLGTIQASHIELSPDFESGGLLFQVSVSIRHLLSNNDDLPRLGLPDARPIPHIRSGSLKARILDLPIFSWAVFYQGEDVFALFLPIDLDPLPLNVTVRMRDEAGNLLGVFTAVAKSQEEDISGVLFLFPIEGSRSEQYIERSLRN